MNARQLTRTGLVLLGAYFLAIGVTVLLVKSTVNLAEDGWADVLTVGLPILLVASIPGVVLIASSHWVSRRLEPEESQPANTHHVLRVGLFLLGVYLATVAAAELLRWGLLLPAADLFPAGTLTGIRMRVATASVKAVLALAVCLGATRLAKRDERPVSSVIAGLTLLGVYFLVLGVAGLLGSGIFRLQVPDAQRAELDERLVARLDGQLLASLAQCALGALMFLRPQWLLRLKGT